MPGMTEGGETIPWTGVGHHLPLGGTVEIETNRLIGGGRTLGTEAMIEGGRRASRYGLFSTVSFLKMAVRLVIMHVLTLRLLFGLSSQFNMVSHNKSRDWYKDVYVH
jgi:hypothetical protein